jgi:hypothetical protein
LPIRGDREREDGKAGGERRTTDAEESTSGKRINTGLVRRLLGRKRLGSRHPDERQ